MSNNKKKNSGAKKPNTGSKKPVSAGKQPAKAAKKPQTPMDKFRKFLRTTNGKLVVGIAAAVLLLGIVALITSLATCEPKDEVTPPPTDGSIAATTPSNDVSGSDISSIASFDLGGETFIADEDIQKYLTNSGKTAGKGGMAEIPVGIFRYYILEIYENLSDDGAFDKTKPLEDQLIYSSGLNAYDYINEAAKTSTLIYALTARRYDALGFTSINYASSAERYNEIITSYDKNEAFYKANGITKEDAVMCSLGVEIMQQEIFGARYATNGYEEVSLDELAAYCESQIMCFAYIYEPYTAEVTKDVLKAKYKKIAEDVEKGEYTFASVCQEYSAADDSTGKIGNSGTHRAYDDSDDLLREVAKLENNDFIIYEDVGGLMLAQRLPLDDENHTMVKYMYQSLLIGMKFSEFQQEITASAMELTDVAFNEAVLEACGLDKMPIMGQVPTSVAAAA